jgi:hypothetical protein
MLCEAEHRNPNLKLFSYLTSLLTSKILQKLLGVHVYTYVPLLDPPLILDLTLNHVFRLLSLMSYTGNPDMILFVINGFIIYECVKFLLATCE